MAALRTDRAGAALRVLLALLAPLAAACASDDRPAPATGTLGADEWARRGPTRPFPAAEEEAAAAAARDALDPTAAWDAGPTTARGDLDSTARGAGPAAGRAAAARSEPGGAPAGAAGGAASVALGAGPVPPLRWQVRPPLPGPSADTITLKGGERGFTLVDTIVQASQRTAILCYQGGGPYVGTTLRNCVVKVQPGTLPLDRSYWGFRGYDMVDTLLERVELTGFGVPTPEHDEGHAIYLNLAGGFALLDSVVHHNGGQGLQLVKRPGESTVPGRAQGAIVVRGTAFRENGFNPDRGAFQVSIFGTGQPVRLEDVEITAGLDGTAWPGGRTRGALLIEAEGGPDPLAPYAQGRTELLRVRVEHRAPDRPIVQIKGCEELVVRDSTFVGGEIHLDDPTKAGRDCGRIVWQGNHGDAVVIHRGVALGPASRDFVIEGEG